MIYRVKSTALPNIAWLWYWMLFSEGEFLFSMLTNMSYSVFYALSMELSNKKYSNQFMCNRIIQKINLLDEQVWKIHILYKVVCRDKNILWTFKCAIYILPFSLWKKNVYCGDYRKQLCFNNLVWCFSNSCFRVYF